MFHSKPILTGQNRANAKCSHGYVCREIAISIRQNPPHYRGVGDWHSHKQKSRRKKVWRKWVLVRRLIQRGRLLLSARTFTAQCGLLWCTSEFNRLGSDDGYLNLSRDSTVSATSMKCTIIWAAGTYIVLKGGASLMHQISVWCKPVTSSYPTSYGNLYPSVKHFWLCGSADFGLWSLYTQNQSDLLIGGPTTGIAFVQHQRSWSIISIRWECADYPTVCVIYSAAKLLHCW